MSYKPTHIAKYQSQVTAVHRSCKLGYSMPHYIYIYLQLSTYIYIYIYLQLSTYIYTYIYPSPPVFDVITGYPAELTSVAPCLRNYKELPPRNGRGPRDGSFKVLTDDFQWPIF